VMNADGTNQTRITFTPTGSEGTVDWSPDGTRLFFDRETGTASDLFSLAAGGGDEKQLTTTGGAGNPVVSPDGTKVAFAQIETPADPTIPPHDQVYTMNPDGSNQKRLFFGGFDSDRPEDWKSHTILYRVETATQFQIWSTDDAGNAQTTLVQNAAQGTLSPDLARIAYAGLVTGAGFDIFVANADGTGTPQRLTNTTGKFNNFPDWGN
jgi:Tol biopolymer transport system component